MKQNKFLEEVKIIENKVRDAAGEQDGQVGFLGLVDTLVERGDIDKGLIEEIANVWDMRNRIYAEPRMGVEVTQTARDSLVQIIKRLTV